MLDLRDHGQICSRGLVLSVAKRRDEDLKMDHPPAQNDLVM